jgi:IS1 family transposase
MIYPLAYQGIDGRIDSPSEAHSGFAVAVQSPVFNECIEVKECPSVLDGLCQKSNRLANVIAVGMNHVFFFQWGGRADDIWQRNSKNPCEFVVDFRYLRRCNGGIGGTLRDKRVRVAVKIDRIFDECSNGRHADLEGRYDDPEPRTFFANERLDTVSGGISAFLCRVSSIAGNSYRLLQYSALDGHFSERTSHLGQLFAHRNALPGRFLRLMRHDLSLAAIDHHLPYQSPELQKSNNNQKSGECYELPLYICVIIGLTCGGAQVGGWMWIVSSARILRLCGWLILALSFFCLITDLGTFAFGRPFTFWRFRWLLGEDEHCNNQPFHGGKIVTQKYLTDCYLCNTVIGMANVLNVDKQIAIIGALAEGSSIRSIERITGVHRDTIMRLGVKVGQGCATLLDAKMRELPCHRLEFDEIWGFIGKKQRHIRVDDDPQFGDVWTFCAIDAESKLVPSFKCGKRDLATAKVFVSDVASRMTNRVQISADALRAYVDAIEQVFGTDVDFGQIVKTYEHDESQHPNRKYSAPEFVSVEKRAVTGKPDMDLVSTSYIERLNATTRLHMRRLTRLTLAFSKKLENFEAAVALHFAYYNLVKRHVTLRCTPAMAAGVERDFWSVGDLVEATA